MAGERYYETERLTAAAEVALPKAGLWLVAVRVWGTTLPGTFGWLFDGAATAHFPSPTNGTRGYRMYPCKTLIKGSSIPAAAFSFNGNTTIVELIFSDVEPTTIDSGPLKGQPVPDISSYRALRFARTDAGAVDAAVAAQNFAGGNGSPKGAVVHISASAGRMRYPPSGGLRGIVEADRSESIADYIPAPHIPPTASLAPELATDAAATIQAVVYY